MAQLNATTIKDSLTVNGSTSVSGALDVGSDITMENDKSILAAGTDGGAVRLITVNTDNNLVIGSSTYPHSGNTTINAPKGNIVLKTIGSASTGGVEIPSGHINVSNGGGLRVKGSDGVYKTAIYLNSSNNLHIGNYDNDSDAHGNNTWLNAAKGSIGMKCSTHAIYFSAYNGDTIKAYFRPYTHNKDLALGSSSNPWYRLYAVNATTTTSDRREKSDINYIADYPVPFRSNGGNAFENFFDNLQPATFGINSENADNFHIGFIAQEVEEAAVQADLPAENLGLLVHEYWTNEETGEEEDVYCLGYEEFIALNTYMIQKQKARITEQQATIDSLEERIAKLEKLLEVAD